ncbi:MAG: lasso peptide biosynthesis protein [Bacteroidales bacterium]|nr:lasso peptide biosynthesis protein [Bacteroidales bacterium]
MNKKLWKYRKLIWLVVIVFTKYQILRSFTSDKAFLNSIRREKESCRLPDESNMQPFKNYSRLIDIIINKLAPSSTCVIRSLVKRDVLSNYGLKTEVFFGLLRKDNEIRAHAWLSTEHDHGYSKVYKVS